MLLNVHFHTLVLDGVFTPEPSGALRFVPAPPPTARELARLAGTIARRVTRLLRRHGRVFGDGEPAEDAAPREDAGALAALAAASVTGRSLLVATPGARVGRVGGGATAPLSVVASRCHARVADFDLHAGRTVRAEDRGTLERLCHYLLRPPLAQERLALLPDGRVGLTLAHPWADGTRALVFSGVEFLEKLAVLIPKPRVNLLIYHGILGARAHRRPAAVAQAVPLDAERLVPMLPGGSSRRGWAWADLLRRVFAIDVLACECGARLRFVATIEDPPVVQRILAHLGLPTATPVPAPARPPPWVDADGGFAFPA